MELPDVPACCPGRNGRGGLLQVFAAFVVRFAVQGVAVNIF